MDFSLESIFGNRYERGGYLPAEHCLDIDIFYDIDDEFGDELFDVVLCEYIMEDHLINL